MYPAQHAATSGAAALLAALYLQLSPLTAAVWAIAGIAAGVLVDVDHVVLAVLLHGRWDAARTWIRQPVTAVLDPEAFLEDIDPAADLRGARILSHAAVLGAALLAVGRIPLATPVAVALSVHILVDIAWDVRETGGLPYL
ncbi:MAG: hypothetical protein SVU88_02315 [Candidatus Nanohaloarchaea archaeon]|nr:hypothetical protein [Candidatus Nanohaloarchaea archaeon]